MRVEGWRPLLEATRRKVAIAGYHNVQLQRLLCTNDHPVAIPSVEVQAHFEGVVFSIMAAVDQVAQAINAALHLRVGEKTRTEKAFQAMEGRVPELLNWYKNPLGRDLYKIRTRAIHFSYEKTRSGLAWCVEDAGPGYDGSRDLRDYCGAAVRYAEELVDFLPQLECALDRSLRDNADPSSR